MGEVPLYVNSILSAATGALVEEVHVNHYGKNLIHSLNNYGKNLIHVVHILSIGFQP